MMRSKMDGHRVEVRIADGSGVALPSNWTAGTTRDGVVLYAAHGLPGEWSIGDPSKTTPEDIDRLSSYFADRGVTLEKLPPSRG